MTLYKGTTLIAGTLPNSANQDLSNLSSTGQDIIDGKVSKSGDTMTGTLNISNANSQKFNIVCTDVTKGTTPASDKYTTIQFNDSSNSSTWQNTRLGSVEHKLATDGSSRMILGATQNVAASGTQAQIWVQESSSGVASCSFPNTLCADGQWVYSQTAVASGISGTSSYSTDFDLSSYLPNDNYNYECLFVAGGGTSTSTGNTARIWLKTAISGQSLVACATTRTSSRMYCAGCATVIIGTDRKVTLSLQNSGGTTSEVYFNLNAYRRVGTNG